MALQSITNINIDFVEPKYIMIDAKQYDDCSRLIYITCYNDGSIYNLSAKNHTAFIKFRKADRRYIYNFCDIDHKGRIVVELTKQMLAAAGICYAEIVVLNRGNVKVNADTGYITIIDQTARIATMTFEVNVYESAIDDSLVESSDEFFGLNDALDLLTADFSDAVQKAKSWAVGTNNQARDGDEYDNSEYYSKVSKSWAVGGTGVRTNENVNNSQHWSEQSNASAVAASESQSKAEAAQSAAETAQSKSEEAQDKAETAQSKSELAQSLAETAQNKAEEAQSAAETAEQNAEFAQSKSEEAQGKAEAAQNKAEEAQGLAEVAQSAAESALNKTKESQSKAELAEQNATNSALMAQSYAVGDSGIRDGENEDNAKHYCNKALESASNIEANADIISNAAESANSSALNAANSANEASTSAGAAADSADVATASATSASTSAETAGKSAEAAASSEANAHTYYLQVEEITTGLSGAFMPMGTIEFAELVTLLENGEIEAGHLYNISDNFSTNESFKRGAGIEYAAGTNVYLTSDGYLDVFAGMSVTGVKGSAETSYRRGNVNITVENIGAVSSDDVATVDEVKELLGI